MKSTILALVSNKIMPKDEFRKKKAKFLASLARMGYHIKIDLVQYDHNESLLCKEIKKQPHIAQLKTKPYL